MCETMDSYSMVTDRRARHQISIYFIELASELGLYLSLSNMVQLLYSGFMGTCAGQPSNFGLKINAAIVNWVTCIVHDFILAH